ncbi:MAG TPA: ABC transporter transmembrane domain-containing protein, partial [Gemmatimonadales bacterium]|nr:ABC transporter transmembrane domain-containing protein [Gemmatimonadales bacterium]
MGLALLCSVVGSLLDSVTLVTLVPLLRQLFGTAAAIPTGNTALERWLDRLTAPILEGTTPDQALARMVVVLAAGVLLKNVATYVGQQLSVRVQERVVADLRARLFGHLLRMDLDFFRRMRTGELVTMVMQETGTVKNVVTATFLS